MTKELFYLEDMKTCRFINGALTVSTIDAIDVLTFEGTEMTRHSYPKADYILFNKGKVTIGSTGIRIHMENTNFFVPTKNPFVWISSFGNIVFTRSDKTIEIWVLINSVFFLIGKFLPQSGIAAFTEISMWTFKIRMDANVESTFEIRGADVTVTSRTIEPTELCYHPKATWYFDKNIHLSKNLFVFEYPFLNLRVRILASFENFRTEFINRRILMIRGSETCLKIVCLEPDETDVFVEFI